MIGLSSLKDYKSVFNKPREGNKFELYKDRFDESSFTNLKNSLEEILDFSNVSSKHLQDKRIKPRSFEACKNLQT